MENVGPFYSNNKIQRRLNSTYQLAADAKSPCKRKLCVLGISFFETSPIPAHILVENRRGEPWLARPHTTLRLILYVSRVEICERLW